MFSLPERIESKAIVFPSADQLLSSLMGSDELSGLNRLRGDAIRKDEKRCNDARRSILK